MRKSLATTVTAAAVAEAIPSISGATEEDPRLPGEPSTPFTTRTSLLLLPQAALLDWLSLALILPLAGLLTRSAQLTYGSLLPLAACALATVASIAWRWWSAASSIYLRYNEALSTLLRLGWVGCEAAMVLLQGQLVDVAATSDAGADGMGGVEAAGGPSAGQMARHISHLLVASSALVMLLQSMRPLRISLSVSVQFALLLLCGWRSPSVCAAGPLAAPAAQQLTHHLYHHLQLLSFLCPLPLSVFASPDASAECVSVLRFCQATVGFLLPLGWQAVREGRLFDAHARQRRQAGLPPECGATAWVHASCLDLAHVSIRPYLYLFAVGLLGCAWDWAAFISSS